MNIAEKLQNLRKQKELSQEKLIEELEKIQGVKIAISSLRNYENVKKPRIPKNEILNALANFYNVDIEYLLNDSAENLTKENIKINQILGLSDESIKNIKEANENGFSEYLDTLLNDKYILRSNVVNIARYKCLYSLRFINIKNIRKHIFQEKINLAYTQSLLNDCIEILKPFDEFELIFSIEHLISLLKEKINRKTIISELEKIETILEDRIDLTAYRVKENSRRYLLNITKPIRNILNNLDEEGENNEHKGNRKK